MKDCDLREGENYVRSRLTSELVLSLLVPARFPRDHCVIGTAE